MYRFPANDMKLSYIMYPSREYISQYKTRENSKDDIMRTFTNGNVKKGTI